MRDRTDIVGAGALVELQAPREPPVAHGGHRLMVSNDADQLAVTSRLFATRSAASVWSPEGTRWRSGFGDAAAGRSGNATSVHHPCRRTQLNQERFLSEDRLHRRDVADEVNQMLGRDAEQHRPPQLSWDTLIEVLADHGMDLTEEQLIALPFCCEMTPDVEAELCATGI